jgi:hypothetical protein
VYPLALAIVDVISTTEARVKHRTVWKVLKRPALSLFYRRKFWQKIAAAGRITLANTEIEYIAQWDRWLRPVVSGNRKMNQSCP